MILMENRSRHKTKRRLLRKGQTSFFEMGFQRDNPFGGVTVWRIAPIP